MEELNHDLTQGSRLGDINERWEKKKEKSHFFACIHHSIHQDPTPTSSQNGTLLGWAVFPNWMLSLVLRKKKKDHHSSGSSELSTTCHYQWALLLYLLWNAASISKAENKRDAVLSQALQVRHIMQKKGRGLRSKTERSFLSLLSWSVVTHWSRL